MSGRIVHLEPDAHEAAQRLLPWYVTDRLDRVERAQVDAHLESCFLCRAELETERDCVRLLPGVGSPGDVDAGWAAMRARLDETPAPRSARALRPSAWFAGRRPVHPAWAAPALLSVALIMAIGATLHPATPAGEYHALAAPAADTATAVVRFRPDATEAQIRRCLNESGARLVDGPTVTDAYVVRLPRERYAEALEKLRRQPAVALVEALETAPP